MEEQLSFQTSLGNRVNRTAVSDSNLSEESESSLQNSSLNFIELVSSTMTTVVEDYTEVIATEADVFRPSPLFQALIYSMYSIVFVLALLGNGLVCAVVFSSRRKWTVTNYFISNLAAGDILMTLFCVPFSFVPTLILQYWPFGEVMCRIVHYSQAVSVFVSAYTMVAISGDRYLAIVYPLRPRMTRRQAKVLILLVWLLATLTALPILIVSGLGAPSQWHKRESTYTCMELWPGATQQSQYTLALLLLQFCIPLTILVFSYGRICVEVWGKKAPGEAQRNRDIRLALSKRRMIKMMMIVVAVFVVCWLPLNILQMIGDNYTWIWNWYGIPYVWFGCHWLAMSHSAYNPLIYCCFNAKFRQGLIVVAASCGCVSRDAATRESEPLQRVNTFTTTYTCTNGSTRSKQGSCRVLLHAGPSGHGPLVHSQAHSHGPAESSLIRSGRRSRSTSETYYFKSHFTQCGDQPVNCTESHM